ncbi:MAG: hypothetical protein COS88_03530 [Chloroflexi bacterium CG07_land_8_20_14_0_80_51_10]|nr:MAG: hypothetical protein COS88_03530 [Chloroflexi bacterium CG07_land_8_20_14_0_80_51_10]
MLQGILSGGIDRASVEETLGIGRIRFFALLKEYPIGGYQVCPKWLQDRKGRTLNFDDLLHYKLAKQNVRLFNPRRAQETWLDHAGIENR